MILFRDPKMAVNWLAGGRCCGVGCPLPGSAEQALDSAEAAGEFTDIGFMAQRYAGPGVYGRYPPSPASSGAGWAQLRPDCRDYLARWACASFGRAAGSGGRPRPAGAVVKRGARRRDTGAYSA
jgi:hypothetical protein